jgi:hypothetical protein
MGGASHQRVVQLAWVAGTDAFSPKAFVADSSGRLRPV